jgi:hypothetical protein
MAEQTTSPEGYVFGVSGEGYARLAARAAMTLRKVAPDAQIDIFTDAEVPDGVFDRVHQLEKSWFRPKFEALRRSRFERTVYLDADMFILADISDVFEVLERFDFAAVHSQRRNSAWSTELWRRPLPAAFPQINGGLLGIRKSPRTLAFIEEADRIMDAEGLKKDQPLFRELLFDSDLRIAILPPEYNLTEFRWAEMYTPRHGAPRVLHHFKLHAHIWKGRQEIGSITALVGPQLAGHIRRLIAVDRAIQNDPDAPDKAGAWQKRFGLPLVDQGPLGTLRLIWLQACRVILGRFSR